MSYQVGPHRAKRARDFVDRQVLFLEELTTVGGNVFAEGSVGEIRRVWKGKFTIRQYTAGGAVQYINQVSGYQVRLLVEDKSECRCAGPEYDPDVPCPVHPKVTAP